MSLVTIKNKYQVVIPQSLRVKARLNIGDLLDAKIEDGKITLTPKTAIDRGIAESLKDFRKGHFYGPFNSANEAIASMKAEVKKHTAKKS